MLCDCHAYPTLPASDLTRARRFYEQVLGFEPSEESPAGILYDARGSTFMLYPSQYAGTNQATAVSFETDDLTGLVGELKGKGVKFEDYDFGDYKTVDGIMTVDDGRSAWFTDTEGNIISVFQTARAHRWPRDEALERRGA
jgi:predicted enzyme related to lactoylglutathione lyase